MEKDEENKEVFWVIGQPCQSSVIKVEGFDRTDKRGNKLWWFPSIGYTLWEGIQAFRTREEALLKLQDIATKKIAEWETVLKYALKGQLSNPNKKECV
jgi:hypothetical protein